ncbi:MAG TPA: sugar ABC transporter ATP-binding protein [Euzebyales bacterium]|nr:sugar ABC transporter ATP-binding protein [Euzebyales bacterium]
MPLLEVAGVRKAYPGVQALAGVDLSVEAGETHALLGENGAGKSTLMKTIAGAVVPDDGRLLLDGDAVPFGSPQRSRQHGIGIVYQELSLVPSLTVAENVLLGRLPRTRLGLVDWRAVRTRVAPHLERIGLKVDPRRRVRDFGMAERQLVEIAKALSSDVRVLLLDEPTSALSDRESRRLFAVIRDLTDSGVAVVYVSHRLPEVVQIADRVTVLRDGAHVATVDAAGVNEGQLARMMVGRAVGETAVAQPRAAAPGPSAPVVLRASGLARPPRLSPIDLEIRAGEIVGIFGLVGAGRSRLARTLFGLEPATAGALELFGEPVALRSPADAIAAGMGYVGEDRAAGLIHRMSVGANITLASLDRARRGPVMDFSRERELAGHYVDELGIRVPTVDALVETLSGGNQQKVLLARWLCSQARILILDDPVRGVDVGAKEEVFRLVTQLSDEGVAVLLMTSEIKEARTYAHQVLVMADGQITAALDPAASEDDIMTAAGGVHG